MSRFSSNTPVKTMAPGTQNCNFLFYIFELNLYKNYEIYKYMDTKKQGGLRMKDSKESGGNQTGV